MRKINSHSFGNVDRFAKVKDWYCFVVASGVGSNGYKVSRYIKRHLLKKVEQLYMVGIEDESKLEDCQQNNNDHQQNNSGGGLGVELEDGLIGIGNKIENAFRKKEQKIYKYHNNMLSKNVSLKGFSTIGKDYQEIVKETDQFIDKKYRIMIKSFIKGSVETNQKLMRKSEIDCDSSGASCLALFVDNSVESENEEVMNYGKIIVSNLGDFRVLQFYQNDNNVWIMKQLNSDLGLMNYSEQIRIRENGGVIEREKNSKEVDREEKIYFPGEDIPGTGLSRCFGNMMGRQLGVLAVPDINIYTIDKKEVQVMVVSQSFIKYVGYEEIVELMLDKQDGMREGVNRLMELVEQRNGQKQDMTVMVIQIS